MLKDLFERSKKDLKLLGFFTAIVLFYEALIALIVFLFTNFPFNRQFLNPFYELIRWDAWHYLDIVNKGYSLGEAVFFPLYPALVDFFSYPFGDVIRAGFFVSWASLVIALFYLWKLLNLENSAATAKKTILLLLFFPYAVFFSTIYTESLFLALAVAFFYYLKKEKWLTAAVCGFFAVLTRNVGIFLFAVMLWRYWEIFHSLPFLGKLGRERLKEKIKFLSFSLLIPLGMAAYCLFCYFKLGHPLAFITGQSAYQSRVFEWPWQVLAGFYRIIFVQQAVLTDFYYFFRTVIIEATSFLLLLAATVYFFGKKENLYGIFCLLNLLLFSTMFPLYSVNRFVLVIFPIYIFISRLAKKDAVFFPVLALSIILFVFNVFILALGAWVG
jgi:Gpi18-like mannosyltransferase